MSFERDGFLHTPGLVPSAACRSLVAAWQTEVVPWPHPLARQHNARTERHHRSADGFIVNPVHNPHLLEPFPRLRAALATITALPELRAHAERLLGGPAALLQTAVYESAEGSAAHRDDHPFRPDAPMVGAWIALEPIVDEAGPFLVFPGSHRIDDAELDRLGRAAWQARHVERRDDPQVQSAYAERLAGHLATAGPVLATLSIGDAVWWDRRTVHGARAPTLGARRTRRSLNLHFIRQTDMPGTPEVAGGARVG